ncbi:MAG: mechanosensitive ion channel family protein [Eubacterium sp.]|nr:mechanosensitive ion channel family protein [Eubacterium sp.]
MDAIAHFYTENKFYADIVIGVVIFIAFFLLRKVFAGFILDLFGRLIFLHKPEDRKRFKKTLLIPFSAFFVLLGAYIGVYINYQHEAITKAFKILAIITICRCILSYLTELLHTRFDLNDEHSAAHGVVVKFISNIFKIVTLCITVVMIVSELGYNINGLITGLGVGGLAVSLAAQDTLKNIISGFIILYDKPFVLGDLIETPDFKGFVEDITMRSTRLRKLDDSIVVVPNSSLADSNITNYAVLKRRLVEFNIGLLYSTPNSVIEKCEKEIKEFLMNCSAVDNETIRVRFTDHGTSSLNIIVRCYVDITDIEIFFEFTETLNFKIKEIIENNDTDFAYPTRSIKIEKI